MADLRWQLSYKGETYEFDADRDLTVRALSQVKKWYGPDVGRYQLFILALGQGDPDAWASAMWMALRAANYKPLPQTPEFLDFSIGPVMEKAGETQDEEADDGTATETVSVPGPTAPGVESESALT